ncbi:PH domain-containing protein [Sporosarcina cyprini]|uniref:PH domain-containing protein n=1 Tax=Sporosarcina cyprini TaxID=2910523 RepID=UPI001EDE34F3|nr:PH domain-containing protein [Sporosarcina cyprini]MCG3086731.1 PH domain-containing protein [Sporosarcina cyprini]
MSEQRYRLHWVTAIIETLKAAKEAILPLIVLLFANGRRDWNTGLWYIDYLSFLILGGLIILLSVSGLIKWLRFQYWFEDDELRIESGLFVRKKRYIPFERIQSLDYTEGIFHRPFKLVKVNVETAGSSSLKKSEGELTAITKEAARQIEQHMAEAKRKRKQPIADDLLNEESFHEETVETVKEKAHKVFALTSKDLFILATTSGGIGVILSGVAIFLSQFGDLIPYEWIFDEFASFVKFGVLIVGLVVFAGLVGVWLLSVIMTFFSYYGFTVSLEEDDIVITRGLLEKKRVTVPLKRVQSISVIQNPLRQPFGYASVSIHSAGGGVGDGAKINLFPLVKKKDVQERLEAIFPNYHFEEPTTKLPKRGKAFFYRIDFLWMLPVIGALTYFFFPYGLLSLLIIPVIIAFGLWQYRSGAYAIYDSQLTMRFRGISLQTAYMTKRRIQSLEMKQSYFNKRKQVATIVASAKSGMGQHRGIIHFMEEAEAERILSWYEKRLAHKAAPLLHFTDETLEGE